MERLSKEHIGKPNSTPRDQLSDFLAWWLLINIMRIEVGEWNEHTVPKHFLTEDQLGRVSAKEERDRHVKEEKKRKAKKGRRSKNV